MSNAPVDIHTVTAGYLRRFALDGRVVVHHATKGQSTKGVKGVGYQRGYWGPDKLSAAVEESLRVCESRALRVLRRPPGSWPLSTQDRGDLAEFMGVHVVRTPAFGAEVRKIGEQAIKGQRPWQQLRAAEFVVTADAFRSPQMHAETILRQVSRVASLLACMQWTVVEFEDEVLATGDQPVIFIPPVPGLVSAASSVPASGLLSTVEVRFPLDPRRLLLLTWHDGKDTVRPVAGTRDFAANVNCSVKAQSLEQWFSMPGTRPPAFIPPFLEPQVFPISPLLYRDCSNVGRPSTERKIATDRFVTKMIEDGASHNKVRWVKAA